MDRVQMEQVFLNAVKNAIEAIGRDGVITVRLTRREGRPAVVIEESLLDFFANSPLRGAGLDLVRDDDTGRRVRL
jgi:signal transduction histidine kinase